MTNLSQTEDKMMTTESIFSEIERLLGPELGPQFNNRVARSMAARQRREARLSNPAYVNAKNAAIAKRSIGETARIEESKGVFFIGTIREAASHDRFFRIVVESKNGTRRCFDVTKVPVRRLR